VQQLRQEINRAIATLRRRHASTTDQAEKKEILNAIKALTRMLPLLNQAALLDAANVLAAATETLEQAVAAARTGPFDGYLAALEGHLSNLFTLSGAMHAREGLPAAPERGAGETRRAPARGARARALVMPRGLPAPAASKDFESLRDEYQAWYDACTLRRGCEGNIAYYVKLLNRGRALYEDVGANLGGIPWEFIGIIHGMECGFNFAAHLHNGDPLTARTVRVPAGRPKSGSPPFTWRESAADALTLKGFHHVSDWSVPRMLYLLEKYNGFGYRMRGVPTPYLWSFSSLYEKGKFVADGKYDPDKVSKQCGAAVMLKSVRAG
jgi:lysozyme family protein